MAKELIKVKYRKDEFYFEFFNIVDEYPNDLNIMESKELFPYEDLPYQLFDIKYRDDKDDIKFMHIGISTNKETTNEAAAE